MENNTNGMADSKDSFLKMMIMIGKEHSPQDFEGKPHPEGEYNAWTLEESNCRFYEGDPYGGAEASFLCEKLGYDASCKCFDK